MNSYYKLLMIIVQYPPPIALARALLVFACSKLLLFLHSDIESKNQISEDVEMHDEGCCCD